jgi:hypothetical protein
MYTQTHTHTYVLQQPEESKITETYNGPISVFFIKYAGKNPPNVFGYI